MTTYKSVPGGFLNLDTGVFEPYAYREYTAANPAPRPLINTSDDQPALQSMADGRMYTSKAKMRESYKAGGNPQGIEYAEVGTDQSFKKPAPRKKTDPDAIKSSVERAVADLENGRFA